MLPQIVKSILRLGNYRQVLSSATSVKPAPTAILSKQEYPGNICNETRKAGKLYQVSSMGNAKETEQ